MNEIYGSNHRRKKRRSNNTNHAKRENERALVPAVTTSEEEAFASPDDRINYYSAKKAYENSEKLSNIHWILLIAAVMIIPTSLPAYIDGENYEAQREWLTWAISKLLWAAVGEGAYTIAMMLVNKFYPALSTSEENVAVKRDYQDPTLKAHEVKKYLKTLESTTEGNHLMTLGIGMVGMQILPPLLKNGTLSPFVMRGIFTFGRLYSGVMYVRPLTKILVSLIAYYRNNSTQNKTQLDKIAGGIYSSLEWKKTDRINSRSPILSFFYSLRALGTTKNECFYTLSLKGFSDNRKNLFHLQFVNSKNKSVNQYIEPNIFLLNLGYVLEKTLGIKILATNNEEFIMSMSTTTLLTENQVNDAISTMKNRLSTLFDEKKITLSLAKLLRSTLDENRYTLIYVNDRKGAPSFDVEFELSQQFIEKYRENLNQLIEKLNEINGVSATIENDRLFIKNLAHIEQNIFRNIIADFYPPQEGTSSQPTKASPTQKARTTASTQTSRRSYVIDTRIKPQPHKNTWFLPENTTAFWKPPIPKNPIQNSGLTVIVPNKKGWVVKNESTRFIAFIEKTKKNQKISVDDINAMATKSLTKESNGDVAQIGFWGGCGLKRRRKSGEFVLKKDQIRIALVEKERISATVNGKEQKIRCFSVDTLTQKNRRVRIK